MGGVRRDFFFAAGLTSALAAGIACGGAADEGEELVGGSASALTASVYPVSDTYLDEDRRNRAFGGQTIAAIALAIVGNATVVNNQSGFLTLWPNGVAQPLVASSNFAAGQVLNRHFTVGLGATGLFNIFAAAQTDLVIDVSGYFAP